jgi:hypothetical protein
MESVVGEPQQEAEAAGTPRSIQEGYCITENDAHEILWRVCKKLRYGKRNILVDKKELFTAIESYLAPKLEALGYVETDKPKVYHRTVRWLEARGMLTGLIDADSQLVGFNLNAISRNILRSYGFELNEFLVKHWKFMGKHVEDLEECREMVEHFQSIASASYERKDRVRQAKESLEQAENHLRLIEGYQRIIEEAKYVDSLTPLK